jgi:hypothetical protein
MKARKSDDASMRRWRFMAGLRTVIKTVIKVAILLMVISFGASILFNLWNEVFITSLDRLLYLSRSYEPVQSIWEISGKTIVLEPYENMYYDEASFAEYLRRLEEDLGLLEEFVGISGIYKAPAGIRMYYKENGVVEFERRLFGGQYSLVPVQWGDHDIAAGIVTVDKTLIKLGVIPGLDGEIFGRAYKLTEEIPVLVGGKNAQSARVGALYQAVLCSRLLKSAAEEPVAPEDIVNVRIAGIVDLPIAVAEMVNATNDIAIMPPVVNEDGTGYVESLPSRLKIIFNTSAYDDTGIAIKGAAEILEAYGRTSPDNDGHYYALPLFYERLKDRDYLAVFLATLIMGLLLVVLTTLLVNKLLRKYLDKPFYRIIASAIFPPLCFLMARYLDFRRFFHLDNPIDVALNRLAGYFQLQTSPGPVPTWGIISEDMFFNKKALLIPLLLLALFLIIASIFPVKPISITKKEKGHD